MGGRVLPELVQNHKGERQRAPHRMRQEQGKDRAHRHRPLAERTAHHPAHHRAKHRKGIAQATPVREVIPPEKRSVAPRRKVGFLPKKSLKARQEKLLSSGRILKTPVAFIKTTVAIVKTPQAFIETTPAF